MSAWFVYIIQSDPTGRLYTGITTDPVRRLQEHNGGRRGAKATRAGRPWRLAFQAPYGSRGEALRREAAIKRFRRAAKLRLCLLWEQGRHKRQAGEDGKENGRRKVV